MIATLAGMILGLSVFALIYPFLTTRPRLLSTLGATQSLTGQFTPAASPPASERVGAWVTRYVPSELGMKLDPGDLAIMGKTVNQHAWTKVYTAGAAFLGSLVLAAIFQFMLSLPLAATLAVAAGLTLAGWVLPDAEAQHKASRARDHFARGVAIYVELVAAERRRDAPPGVALENAAAVGDSWIFRRLRQELAKAQYNKIQPWDALENLADQIKVPELGDAARIMRLSGDRGASVYESLRALGRGLRVRMLNAQAAEEAKASDKMENIVLFVAIAFVAIILAPMLLNLM